MVLASLLYIVNQSCNDAHLEDDRRSFKAHDIHVCLAVELLFRGVNCVDNLELTRHYDGMTRRSAKKAA